MARGLHDGQATVRIDPGQALAERMETQVLAIDQRNGSARGIRVIDVDQGAVAGIHQVPVIGPGDGRQQRQAIDATAQEQIVQSLSDYLSRRTLAG